MSELVTANGNGRATSDDLSALRPISLNDMKPIGETGLVQFGGILYGEARPELTGVRWYSAVREMKRFPVIKGMLFAVEMLIRRAEWHFDAADGEGVNESEAEKMVEFVESCREDMRTSWADTLATTLSFLPYGYCVQEIVYKRRLGQSRSQPSHYDDGMIGWDMWAPRSQETIEGWEFDDRGVPTAVRQRTQHGGTVVSIPLDRCIHVTTGSDRGSPEGESVLLAAYNDWDAIRKLQLIEAIGIERDLAGLPIALLPKKFLDPNASVEDKKFYNSVRKIVTGIRQNDQAGIVFPLEYTPEGKPAMEIKLLSTGGSRQFDTGAVIGRRITQMTMAMLADFLTIGHGATGSYALSVDKTNLFTTAVSAWLDTLADAIREQAVIPLLAKNGKDAKLCPSITALPPDSEDLQKVGAYVAQIAPLLTANFNKEDQVTLTQHLLDLADMPVLTSTVEEIEEEKKNPTPPPVITPFPDPNAPPAPTSEDTVMDDVLVMSDADIDRMVRRMSDRGMVLTVGR